ncbi:U1 small nuclear ribonucleoprotein 70 kDa [Aphelenchoides bicaudatus]|nr:U1 small nuclear ribonucleoprotein 70 kDa [Aphelenchoides bicaudatus]
MTQFLPDNLLALFAPRDPVVYKPPADKLLVERKRVPINGLGQYVGLFEDPKDTPPKPYVETRDEKKRREAKEKEELISYKLEQGIAKWAPAENPNATMDPYKTLFVARISYETSESKLRREFERYGPINKIKMVNDQEGKPRGYAFIEFAHKSDMSSAYKKSDGTKIDGKRVVVDYERGRTQKTWLPRRLGGGKGETRRAKQRRSRSRSRDRNGRDNRDRSRDRDSRRDRDRDDRRDRDRSRDRERRR